MHPEALESVRHLKRRQSDIQDMLDGGVGRAMMLLPDLDLKATPELCESARNYLIKSAKESRVHQYHYRHLSEAQINLVTTPADTAY